MDPMTRILIARAALAVARRVHDGGFRAVVVSGGSHQLSRALLALGWGTLYPDEPMPRTFVLDAAANLLLYKHTAPDEAGGFHPDAEDFRAWMHAHTPELEGFRDQPLAFVDDFSFSGAKYRDLREFFPRDHGFTRVSFFFFAADADTELGGDAFAAIRSAEAVGELHRLGQHIQSKESVDELVDDVRPEAQRLRAEALDELRDIRREMRK